MAELDQLRLDRDTIAVTGPEAGQYLQGQVSQDVLAMIDGQSAWSWILAPNGKVDALLRVTRRPDDDWVLDTDEGWGDALLTRLNRFKLRTKVEFESTGACVLTLRLAVGLESCFGAPGDLADAAGSEPDPESEAERIVAGFPKMGAELTEKTIPAETGLIEPTVSFTKGCYTGQELVARIDSRGGNVPRHLRGLIFTGPANAGTELVDADGKAAGTVTSVGFSPARGWVGLGYVRRGVEVPGRLQTGDGSDAEVRELPR